MTEIKKGDWVYRKAGDYEEVIQCTGIDPDGDIMFSKGSVYAHQCHRLTPLKPGEAKVGDRVAVIVKIDSYDPDVGIITRISGTWNNKMHPRIEWDGCKEGKPLWLYQLARLPDCAQEKPVVLDEIDDMPDEIPSMVKPRNIKVFGIPGKCRDKLFEAYMPENHNKLRRLSPMPIPWLDEIDDMPPEIQCPHPEWEPVVFGEGGYMSDEKLKPTPCPHPEWEGVYDYRGIGYSVRWSGEENHFRAVKRRRDVPGDPSFLCNADHYWGEDGPDETIWTIIEPAPTASIAGPKLPQPRKHGGIKTPVDTW